MDSGTVIKPPRILILEDDLAHQDLILRAFQDDTILFRVTVAGTIREARQVVERDCPDLIIADWILPDGNGLDILPRRDGKVKKPLIIMTSFGDEHLAVEIMKSGAIDYVVKSATVFRELPHIARRALRDWENIRKRKRAEEELEAKEFQLSTIYRNIPEPLFFLSVEQNNCYRFISVNPPFLDKTGLTQAQVVGNDVRQVIPEPSLTLVLDKYKRAISDNTTVTWEEITEYPAGIKYGEVSVTPLTDATGRCTNLVGNVHDITERKRAEEKLRATETRFRALIQNSSDIIRILDRDGRIVYESPSGERILGYPPGLLIGSKALDYVHAEDQERVRKDFQEAVTKTNPGTPTEFRIRKADGTYIWAEALGTNLLDVPGVGGVVITIRPIQQRKEAEKALNESEERLRLALEGADIASWDWDISSGDVVFSDRFYSMLGYQSSELPATIDGWATLMHPDERDRVVSSLRQQIREMRPLCEIEYRLLSKDGHWIWALARGKIAGTDDKGNPTRMTGVNIDITNRKLMESEIRSLNTVLEQRVRDRTEALVKTNEELQEENAQRLQAEKKLRASYDEKVTLLKEIHHRVKNNLQIITSLLNLQSRYIRDESSLAVIRESQNRVKAMALVHENLYRAEDIFHINLHDYLRFLGTGLFKFYDAKSRGIRFTLDISDVNVNIDSAIPLGLIINELISNSLKYAFPEGKNGEVYISVKREDLALTVLYRDTGIGIPAEIDWRDTPSLGLRLVNTLVEQMNGTIELDRTSGTRFTMVLQEKGHPGLS